MSGETHSVRKAIIMAAGIGKRLRPLTLTTPKPLIPVNAPLVFVSFRQVNHLMRFVSCLRSNP